MNTPQMNRLSAINVEDDLKKEYKTKIAARSDIKQANSYYMRTMKKYLGKVERQ